MNDTIFSLALALFLLMDPIGNIPVFTIILEPLDAKKQIKVILREAIIALCIMLVFAFIGDFFLDMLHITQPTIHIAGGIVLFIIAIRMIFPEKQSLVESLALDGEPFIFPLAIPLLSGPTILAAIMIYINLNIPYSVVIPAITIAWLASTFILLLAPLIKKVFKTRGIRALERLMGLVLILLAIQMLLDGLSLFQSLPIA